MLDTTALQQLVEQQVKQEVSARISQALNEDWLKSVEKNAIEFIQNRIVMEFANSGALPELLAAVKTSVQELFASGQIPGLGQYVDYDLIKATVDESTRLLIEKAIDELTIDPVWLTKVETSVSQEASQRALAKLSSTDIRPIVHEYVKEVINAVNTDIFKGIQSQSKNVELTVLDNHVVVENQLTAKDINAAPADIAGAKTKTILSAPDGMMSSFRAHLIPSASDCNKPNGPTRFGPRRFCMKPKILRSAQINKSTVTSAKAKMIPAFARINQPGSLAINAALVMLSPPLQLSYLRLQVCGVIQNPLNCAAPKLHHRESLQLKLVTKWRRLHLKFSTNLHRLHLTRLRVLRI